MSKKDSYTTNSDGFPLWDNYEVMSFESSPDMLEWVQDDKQNFVLSDKVYNAMIDCLQKDIDGVIVATLTVKDGAQIDVLIRRPNFQKIFSGYIERLLNGEKYERLAEIKQQVEKYGLEM